MPKPYTELYNFSKHNPESLTTALCNYFDTDTLAGFIQFLKDEGYELEDY